MNRSDFSRLIRQYVTGFAAALGLSLAAYVAAVSETGLGAHGTMAVILILAITQLVIQSIFFLHLDSKGRSANRTVVFIFTIAMMLVIVIGSLWIMKNLDYRMNMSSDAMNEYMQQQNKKGF